MKTTTAEPIDVRALFPLPGRGRGINHICLSICEHLSGDGVRVGVVTPLARAAGRRPFVQEVLPRLAHLVPYRFIASRAARVTEDAFLRQLGAGDVAYLWSEVSLDLARRLRERGVLVVREKFNCHKQTAKRILDAAYAEVGMEPAHRITEALIAKEKAELALADWVFCPSPRVVESVLEAGVNEDQVIRTSFGWDPARLGKRYDEKPRRDGFTLTFVGLACVRKGAHLLLEAWRRAGVPGRLTIAGRVADDIGSLCAREFERDDVEVLGYVEDIGDVYLEADAFAFPSLEEGGPLVTYEAMAHGLPVLVSPMGAGAVARDGIDGRVLDPGDVDGWAEAIRTLAESAELRSELGAAARTRADEFTWERVGAARRSELAQRVNHRR